MPRIIRRQNPPAHNNYRKCKPYLLSTFHAGVRIATCRSCAMAGRATLRLNTSGPRNSSLNSATNIAICTTPVTRVMTSRARTGRARWNKVEASNSSILAKPRCRTISILIPPVAAHPRTAAGRYTAAHINLDRNELKLWRERKQLLARRLTEIEALIADIAPPPPSAASPREPSCSPRSTRMANTSAANCTASTATGGCDTVSISRLAWRQIVFR